MRVLGVNAVVHDPSAALVVDGEVVTAAEECSSRREHGERPVVGHPRDALELFGAAPVDALAPGPQPVRRSTFADRASA
ncbi:hypothetical protein CLV92_11646 [Kineococcus xinjiangensis]|uniref:Carbamoyltransferase-like protein n=1 Tax=Kineococcus xinjiangensis TaxID=512762 RepID=A0A2S6ID86_9ACTN|nr:hypothetical protein [Kineococcus xinjiangensis]PPK92184.1 hypothetical protein CLV92_11646 [Kineococcus xinjiangensis]